MNFKWKQFFRALVFPLLLGAVYLAQLQCPGLFKQCALWSDHPRWWQFFTSGFLSGNWIHLLFNACGMWVVCSQFASQIRLVFLFVYFVLFSAVSSFLYFHFFMPPHAWLVGASGGVYALIGFLCWFQRRDRVCFLGLRRLSMPFLPAMLVLLGLEFLIATFWIRVLAWQLHLIAFGGSMLVALLAHGAYLLSRRLAVHECRANLFHNTFSGIYSILSRAKEAVIAVPPVLSLD